MQTHKQSHCFDRLLHINICIFMTRVRFDFWRGSVVSHIIFFFRISLVASSECILNALLWVSSHKSLFIMCSPFLPSSWSPKETHGEFHFKVKAVPFFSKVFDWQKKKIKDFRGFKILLCSNTSISPFNLRSSLAPSSSFILSVQPPHTEMLLWVKLFVLI